METKLASALSGVLPQRDTVERVAQTAHDMVDSVAAKAGPAVDRLQAAADNAKESLQSQADALAELEDRWLATCRSYVRSNPLTAIGIGLLAGVLISRLKR